jgi:hypothetical protein
LDIWVCSGLINQILHEHVVSLLDVRRGVVLALVVVALYLVHVGGVGTGEEQSIVASHASVHLHVNENPEILRAMRKENLPRLFHQNLSSLNIAHHASNHERCQFRNP